MWRGMAASETNRCRCKDRRVFAPTTRGSNFNIMPSVPQMPRRDMARPVPSIASCPKAHDLRRHNTKADRAGAQGSHQRALHINAIVSPIPTKAYKPATVTPRQTSAMTLSGWSLICLSGIAPLLGCRPARIDHAGDGKLFLFQV